MKLLKSIALWLIAFIITVLAAYFQRVTGPTYPVKGTIEIENSKIDYKLIRSANNDKNAEISIIAPDTSISALITYKRYKSNDTLKTENMTRVGDKLSFSFPILPSAGKIMYNVKIIKNNNQYQLYSKNDGFVVMRYKSPVPAWVLIPHILIIFAGMLFSTRTGIEALIKGNKVFLFSKITLILLFIGGLVFGPILQKYAFGVFWSGWPFGHDMTDNKTILLVIFWFITVFKLRKNPQNRVYPILASVFVIIVYLIPHSMFGSEIDFTKEINP